MNEASATRDRALFGGVLENYVYSELLKQATWAERDYALHTNRDEERIFLSTMDT
ncbi:MAG: hypothetical protein PHZ14_10050 [Sulfuricella sp.]|nr:hypothetical protein [Sulfuricella sp.]